MGNLKLLVQIPEVDIGPGNGADQGQHDGPSALFGSQQFRPGCLGAAPDPAPDIELPTCIEVCLERVKGVLGPRRDRGRTILRKPLSVVPGTSTDLGDVAETKAIKTAFGAHANKGVAVDDRHQVLAEHLVRDVVERAAGEAPRVDAADLLDAAEHLARRLVREGEEEDRLGLDAVREQARDAPRVVITGRDGEKGAVGDVVAVQEVVRHHGRRHRHGDHLVDRQPLPQEQELRQGERFADLGAGAAADDDRFDPRQLALGFFGKAVVERLADDGTENGVSQKLEPLVRRQPVVGTGSVRQAVAQQIAVLKPKVERGLALVQHLVGEIAFHSPRHDFSRGSRSPSVRQAPAGARRGCERNQAEMRRSARRTVDPH